MDDIICSILMNYKSSIVKLALIDTNHVEFNNYKDNIVEEMNKLIGGYTGFFYKKSIYKVKKGA